LGRVLNNEKKVIDGSIIIVVLLELVYLQYLNSSLYLDIPKLSLYRGTLVIAIIIMITKYNDQKREEQKINQTGKLKTSISMLLLLAVPFIYYCLAPKYTYEQAREFLYEKEEMNPTEDPIQVIHSEKSQPRYYAISGEVNRTRKRFIFDPYDGQYWFDSGFEERDKDVSQ